ncbi:CFI-box-CTERM domain-containing protein [Fusobacterium polymorphum]|uniref:tetratricopeptide repeat protein n=1 Tax=Fusobacterium nucleatum subsp. polymorphum TaxID=76857 RepID=UPI00300A89E4
MKNYYEILNINKDATQEEIRSGYKKMLRKYPPEKEQEKYKEIREAYDTLKDEKSRKNYEAYFHHEKDIKTLEDKYTEHMEAKNYNEAEKVLKKILIISPEIAHIKDKLGEVYVLKKEYDKSIKIYEKLVKEYPDNVDYLIKLGKNYSEKEESSKAIKYYMEAYNLDNSNPIVINEITYSYIGDNQINKAIKFLNENIEKDNKLDFEDFFALSKLLECYIIKNDMSSLKETLEKIKKIAPEDEESKGFISWKLGKFAAELYDMGIYEYSKEISQICLKLTPDIDLIKELYKQANLFVEANKLIKDESIEYLAKFPVVNYFYGDELEDNLKKMALKNLNECVRNFASREMLKKEINKIKWNYPTLYYETSINKFYNEIWSVMDSVSYSRPSTKYYYEDTQYIARKKGACYIATAVYGSYDSDEVLVLRRFRDEILKPTKVGRKMVAFYYKYSPYLSKKLKLNSIPSNIIKFILNRFIIFLNRYIFK